MGLTAYMTQAYELQHLLADTPANSLRLLCLYISIYIAIIIKTSQTESEYCRKGRRETCTLIQRDYRPHQQITQYQWHVWHIRDISTKISMHQLRIIMQQTAPYSMMRNARLILQWRIFSAARRRSIVTW